MKTLFDGNEVPDRTYYFLLDWNEKDNRNFMFKTFNKHRLMDLTKAEYKILWDHATKDQSSEL